MVRGSDVIAAKVEEVIDLIVGCVAVLSSNLSTSRRASCANPAETGAPLSR
jgi:hypothetical protein